MTMNVVRIPVRMVGHALMELVNTSAHVLLATLDLTVKLVTFINTLKSLI